MQEILSKELAGDLIDGGLNLLAERSQLLRWHDTLLELVATEPLEFDDWLSSAGDWARLTSWILFSVGGEYLIKGTCLAHGLGPQPEWKNGSVTLGTLAPYFDKVKKAPASPYLAGLPLPSENIDVVLTSCRRLSDIRNRDVHTLNKNVRASDFPLVAAEFVPSFNLLLATVAPGSAEHDVVSTRRDKARSERPRT